MDNTLFDVGADDVAETNNDWYTPPWVFNAAAITFDLDVAAPVNPARRTCPSKAYLTPIEDGLATPWYGVVWMNPPFSGPAPWIAKFVQHPAGLALVPALPRSRPLSVLMGAADAVTLVNPEFGRPDGTVGILRWPMVLAARGEVCVAALTRVAAADKLASGTYHVRPLRWTPGPGDQRTWETSRKHARLRQSTSDKDQSGETSAPPEDGTLASQDHHPSPPPQRTVSTRSGSLVRVASSGSASMFWGGSRRSGRCIGVGCTWSHGQPTP